MLRRLRLAFKSLSSIAAFLIVIASGTGELRAELVAQQCSPAQLFAQRFVEVPTATPKRIDASELMSDVLAMTPQAANDNLSIEPTEGGFRFEAPEGTAELDYSTPGWVFVTRTSPEGKTETMSLRIDQASRSTENFMSSMRSIRPTSLGFDKPATVFDLAPSNGGWGGIMNSPCIPNPRCSQCGVADVFWTAAVLAVSGGACPVSGGSACAVAAVTGGDALNDYGNVCGRCSPWRENCLPPPPEIPTQEQLLGMGWWMMWTTGYLNIPYGGLPDWTQVMGPFTIGVQQYDALHIGY